MPEHLQQIAAFAAKDEQVARMRIAPERLLHLQGQNERNARILQISRQRGNRPGQLLNQNSTLGHSRSLPRRGQR
jgi:hypothetical protein